MWSWWESLDSVVRFNSWMRLATVALGFGTTVAGGLIWASANRIETLRGLRAGKEREEQRAREQALQEKVEAAEGRQASAEQKLKQIEEKQKRRTVTEEQIVMFVAATKDRPKGTVEMGAAASDNEGLDFGHQIQAMLQRADFDASSFSVMMAGGYKHEGLLLVVANPDNVVPFAVTLADGLKAAGIPFRVMAAPGRDFDHVELFAGYKPQ